MRGAGRAERRGQDARCCGSSPGELKPRRRARSPISGGLGVMPQFVGSVRDERTVRDLLVSVAPPAHPRRRPGPSTRPSYAIMERDDEAAQMRYAQALSDWARRAAGTRPRRSGTCAPMAALGVPYEKAQWRQVRDAVRRRAEAAGAGGAAARPRRGAAARRAGQLPRRARQALAGGAAAGDPQDRAVRLPRPGTAGPGGRRRSSASSPARRAPTCGCTAAGSPRYHEARARAVRALRGAAPALGREARPAEEAGASTCASRPAISHDDGVPLPAAQTRLREVRGGRAAAGAAARAGHHDAAARRADRRAGGHLRGPGADRA